jgi:predicted ester cyclase
MEIVAMVAEGDTVVTRVRWSGTHRGVSQRRLMGGLLIGVPPTASRSRCSTCTGTC